MSGITSVHDASFKVRAAAFPANFWYEFRKAFKVRQSSRTMRNPGGPPWGRIDGRGFTFWVSEVRLSDNRTVPPTWEIRLESLASLNPEGKRYWQEVCEGIERFLRASGLQKIEDRAAAEPRSESREADAEPIAIPDRGIIR